MRSDTPSFSQVINYTRTKSGIKKSSVENLNYSDDETFKMCLVKVYLLGYVLSQSTHLYFV